MRMLSNLNIYDKFSSKKPTLFDGWESDQWPQLMLCDVLSDWVCPPVPRWPPAPPRLARRKPRSSSVQSLHYKLPQFY